MSISIEIAEISDPILKPEFWTKLKVIAQDSVMRTITLHGNM